VYKLLTLEFRKLKGTFLNILLPMAVLMSLALVLAQYASGQKLSLSDTITKSSAFIQMISFACVVISGCYIITREYKNNMAPYLAITPNSMPRILAAKLILLFLETLALQLAIFAGLFLVNTVLNGFDGHAAFRFLASGVLSTLFLGGLIPAVVFIALWRKSFAGSSIFFLVLFMLTFPFSFLSYGYIFPHLLPIILVSKFLGFERYAQISYESGSLVLAATFFVFLYLSVRRVHKKE
jgi:hypothetical protein